MAIAAFGAHCLAMDVVRFMAGKALGLCLTMFRARFMTIRTGCLRVLAEQCEVRYIVVKIGLVELHDIGIPAFMIRVAVGTGFATGPAIKAVKTGFRFDVCADVLVTVHAQRTLFRALESLVTVTALGLEFGMTLDDVTGHDQCFNLGSGSLGYG